MTRHAAIFRSGTNLKHRNARSSWRGESTISQNIVFEAYLDRPLEVKAPVVDIYRHLEFMPKGEKLSRLAAKTLVGLSSE